MLGRLGKSVARGSSLGNAYRSDVAGRYLKQGVNSTNLTDDVVSQNILAGKLG